MRSPEAARALPDLVAAGALSPERAAPLAAAARGEIVSVRAELRALLGLGVALALAGVGAFVIAWRERLGPLVLAALLALAAAGALVALWRRAPPFTWRRAEGADWIDDALLLFAVGLVGADLAWIESQLAWLGEGWPLHLLAMSVVTGALAVRFDSRVGWSVALATFAAWRGVDVTPSLRAVDRALSGSTDRFRLELGLLAVIFGLLAWAMARYDRKAHFEPATTLLAALAAGCALGIGLGEPSWPLWTVALALLGGGVAFWAYRRRRGGLLALGALGAYVAATRPVVALPYAGGLGCLWFAATTLGAVVLLAIVHRRFRRSGGDA